MTIIISASVCTTSFHCLQRAFFVDLFLGDAAQTNLACVCVGGGKGGRETVVCRFYK